MEKGYYHITLHSPLGPRRGTLQLPADQGSGKALVTLLGYENQILAKQIQEDQYQLDGRLDSVMGKIEFAAELTVQDSRFDCMAQTSKGIMRLTGEQWEKDGDTGNGI